MHRLGPSGSLCGRVSRAKDPVNTPSFTSLGIMLTSAESLWFQLADRLYPWPAWFLGHGENNAELYPITGSWVES